MQLISPLMIEHRLIERMMNVLETEAESLSAGGKPNLALLDAAIDFIRMYADKTHHAKEEQILFRELVGRPIRAEHRRLIDQLLAEHNRGRQLVGALEEAQAAFDAGDESQITVIRDKLLVLPPFYREHIRKEDEILFPSCAQYFNADEQEALLGRFWEADRKMIHVKYESLISAIEARGAHGHHRVA